MEILRMPVHLRSPVFALVRGRYCWVKVESISILGVVGAVCGERMPSLHLRCERTFSYLLTIHKLRNRSFTMIQALSTPPTNAFTYTPL